MVDVIANIGEQVGGAVAGLLGVFFWIALAVIIIIPIAALLAYLKGWGPFKWKKKALILIGQPGNMRYLLLQATRERNGATSNNVVKFKNKMRTYAVNHDFSVHPNQDFFMFWANSEEELHNVKYIDFTGPDSEPRIEVNPNFRDAVAGYIELEKFIQQRTEQQNKLMALLPYAAFGLVCLCYLASILYMSGSLNAYIQVAGQFLSEIASRCPVPPVATAP